MKISAPLVSLLFGIVCAAGLAQTKNSSGPFHNDRLKLLSLPDSPILGTSRLRGVAGVWISESSDPDKALVFPQQASIRCENYGADDRKCVVLIVTLGPTKILIGITSLDTEEYAIDRWDEKGLIASYGGGVGDFDSQCQRHVLTMDFGSGAVSLSDIPTHTQGCEAFKTTNSYRLVRGQYYVDTTPNNDADKPAGKQK